MSPSLRRSPIILELDLTQPLVDPHPDDPLGPLLSRGRRQLRPTIRALHEAAEDPRVVGLLAKVGGPLSWATVYELRHGLQAFLDARKPTIAWAETFADGSIGTGAYTLASGFDEIWLQPGGGLGAGGQPPRALGRASTRRAVAAIPDGKDTAVGRRRRCRPPADDHWRRGRSRPPARRAESPARGNARHRPGSVAGRDRPDRRTPCRPADGSSRDHERTRSAAVP